MLGLLMAYRCCRQVLLGYCFIPVMPLCVGKKLQWSCGVQLRDAVVSAGKRVGQGAKHAAHTRPWS